MKTSAKRYSLRLELLLSYIAIITKSIQKQAIDLTNAHAKIWQGSDTFSSRVEI